MDIAIQLQLIKLDGDKMFFFPSGLIKGDYDASRDVFVDEYGYEYNNMDGVNPYGSQYFCNLVSLGELKDVYYYLEDENSVLSQFLYDNMETCYIGYYDEISGYIKVLDFDLNEIEEAIIHGEEKLDFKNAEEQSDKLQFVFDLEDLKALKNYNSIEEIRKYIDKLIGNVSDIKDSIENDNSTEENKETKIVNMEEYKNSKLKLQKEESKKFNLAKLRKEVLSNIIGQDEAVYDLTRAIAINQTSKNPRNKSHILITGPSGTGKTEMVNIISKELDLPFFKANAPDYTKAGYYGKDVPTMLLGLLEAANGDLEKAQGGILIIDEIDKLVSYKDDKGFGKGVLHTLLKILDRDVIEVDVDKHYGEKIMFDTSNLTVIFMGSFDELYEEKQQNKKNAIGFNNVSEEETKDKVRLSEEDLIKWMGPELIGRIGDIISTDELDHKSVLKILKDSKLSQYKIAKQDLADRGVELIATRGYLDEIAKKGYSKKTGARKLNKEFKKSLKYAYDEILTNPKIKTLKLTKKTALNNKEYCVGY